MIMKSNVSVLFSILVIMLCLTMITVPGCGDGDTETATASPPEMSFNEALFGDPPIEYWPYVRWWWPGGAVDSEELKREMALLKGIGVGGVEVQPFHFGFTPQEIENDPAIRSVGTPEFFQKLRVVAEEADNIAMAVDYLRSKYNPELQLIRESQGPGCWPIQLPGEEEKCWPMDKVYWLGDSAVSMMALQPYEPAISDEIRAKLNSPGFIEYASSDKPDTLLGKTIPGPPPKQEERIYVDAQDDEYIIIGGQRIDSVLPDIENYADVLLQYSIQAWRAGDKQQARVYLRQVLDMWDGVGLWDAPAMTDGLGSEKNEAAIYKLALLLITLQIVGEPFDDFNEVEARFWENQDEATGGIRTGIKPDGSIGGGTNTETTALVLLAYDKDRIAMLRGE